MKSLGKRIKEIRNDTKLNQESFGERIGLSTSSISGVEQDKQNISENITNNILREFCVNEAWLKYGIGEKYNEKLKKDKEFMQNELQFMTSTLLEKQRSFFNSIRGYDEAERLEMISVLEEIYSLLDGPPVDQDTYIEYYETVSGMLFEISRYIDYLNSGVELDEYVISKFIRSIHSDLIQLVFILSPDTDPELLSCSSTDGSGISEKDKIILELYHNLDATDQEEIKELMYFKQCRSDALKRKKMLPNSEHGEEAAADEVVSKKMA